jgi:hypothetical protein
MEYRAGGSGRDEEQKEERKRLVKTYEEDDNGEGSGKPIPRRFAVKNRRYVLADEEPETSCHECCHECRYYNFTRCSATDDPNDELSCMDDLPEIISICTDQFTEFDPLWKQCAGYGHERTDWWFRVKFNDCDPDKPELDCKGCYAGIIPPPPDDPGEDWEPGTELPLGTVVPRVPIEEDYCYSTCGWARGSINVGAGYPRIIDEQHNGCNMDNAPPPGCDFECGYWWHDLQPPQTLQSKCESCCDEHCWFQDYKPCQEFFDCSGFQPISVACYCSTDVNDIVDHQDEPPGDDECCKTELQTECPDDLKCMPDTIRISGCCYSKEGGLYLVRPYDPYDEEPNYNPVYPQTNCQEELDDCIDPLCQGGGFMCSSCFVESEYLCPGAGDLPGAPFEGCPPNEYVKVYHPKDTVYLYHEYEGRVGVCYDYMLDGAPYWEQFPEEALDGLIAFPQLKLEEVNLGPNHDPYQHGEHPGTYQWEDCKCYDEIPGQPWMGFCVKYILSWQNCFEGFPEFAWAQGWGDYDWTPFGGSHCDWGYMPCGCQFDAPWFDWDCENPGEIDCLDNLIPGCNPNDLDDDLNFCHDYDNDGVPDSNACRSRRPCDWAHSANANPSGDHPIFGGSYGAAYKHFMGDLGENGCVDCRPGMVCGSLQSNNQIFGSVLNDCNDDYPPMNACSGFCPGDGGYDFCHGIDIFNCGETFECMQMRSTCRYRLRIMHFGMQNYGSTQLNQRFARGWEHGVPISCGPIPGECALDIHDPYGGTKIDRSCEQCTTETEPESQECIECPCCPAYDAHGDDPCIQQIDAMFNSDCEEDDTPVWCALKHCFASSYVLHQKVNSLQMAQIEAEEQFRDRMSGTFGPGGWTEGVNMPPAHGFGIPEGSGAEVTYWGYAEDNYSCEHGHPYRQDGEEIIGSLCKDVFDGICCVNGNCHDDMTELECDKLCMEVHGHTFCHLDPCPAPGQICELDCDEVGWACDQGSCCHDAYGYQTCSGPMSQYECEYEYGGTFHHLVPCSHICETEACPEYNCGP